MENKPIALTLDFGTQSVRASLIDTDGNICLIVKETYDPPYFSTQKGYAEQDPDFYWGVALKCLKKLAQDGKKYQVQFEQGSDDLFELYVIATTITE